MMINNTSTIAPTKWETWNEKISVVKDPQDIKCSHDSCHECKGTGRRLRSGGTCIHMISCNCPQCTPYYM